jgi:hypothetical protein
MSEKIFTDPDGVIHKIAQERLAKTTFPGKKSKPRKLIQPLELEEWYTMDLEASIAFAADDITKEQLAEYVGKLSQEVRRLRLMHGEPVWQGVNTTHEEDEEERKRYEKIKEEV